MASLWVICSIVRGCARPTGGNRRWHPPRVPHANRPPARRVSALLASSLHRRFVLLQLTRGMKPGFPVFTTSLSRCLIWMRLISSNASSGRGTILKFSLARAAVFGVVSNAVPRCTAQANSTCAGVFPTRAAIAVITGSSSSPGLIP